MELVINIGNTNIQFGVFNNTFCFKFWITHSKPFKTSYEYFIYFKGIFHFYGIKKNEIKKIVIGSVVPSITYDVCQGIKKFLNLNVILVDRETPSLVNHKSNQIGTDLYANAVSAHYNYEKFNKIVIDFGTALTFIVIDNIGNIKGGVIAPGIQTSLNALVENTAQLTGIELKKPNKILGMNTIHCTQSGIVYGFLSMIEGLIKRIQNDEFNNSQSIVIATGGLVNVFFNYSHAINFADQLHTLKGLQILGNSL